MSQLIPSPETKFLSCKIGAITLLFNTGDLSCVPPQTLVIIITLPFECELHVIKMLSLNLKMSKALQRLTKRTWLAVPQGPIGFPPLSMGHVGFFTGPRREARAS